MRSYLHNIDCWVRGKRDENGQYIIESATTTAVKVSASMALIAIAVKIWRS